MKSKKGGGLTVSTLILVALMIAVIIIVLLSLNLIYGSNFIPWARYLPDFRQGNKTIEQPQIFRYNLQTREVQYYDGTQSIDFKEKGTIQVENKLITHNIIQQEFLNFLTNHNLNGRGPLPIEKTLRNQRSAYLNEYILETFTNEELLIRYFSTERLSHTDQYIPGYFKLTEDNKFFKRYDAKIQYLTPISNTFDTKTINKFYLNQISSETKQHLNQINGLKLEAEFPQPSENIKEITEDKIYAINEKYILKLSKQQFNDELITYKEQYLFYRIYYNNLPTDLFVKVYNYYLLPSSTNELNSKHEISLEASLTAPEYLEEITNNMNTQEEEIYQEALKWRNSLLDKPISLTYKDTKTNKDESVKVCVERIDIYLVVDLSKPKETCL